MQKLILVAALIASGLLTGEAWAAKTTTLPTTKSAVKKFCGGHLSCWEPCGDTMCGAKCWTTTKKKGMRSHNWPQSTREARTTRFGRAVT